MHRARCFGGSIRAFQRHNWTFLLLQGLFAQVLSCTALVTSSFMAYALLVLVRLGPAHPPWAPCRPPGIAVQRCSGQASVLCGRGEGDALRVMRR